LLIRPVVGWNDIAIIAVGAELYFVSTLGTRRVKFSR